jgi:hypothetical protein
MLPFNPSFRRLVNKFLPQLRDEDLDRHESLIALRQQLLIERDLAPPPQIAGEQTAPAPRDIDTLIERATQLADAILRPFRTEFRLLLRLYDRQRRQQLFKGRFTPFPTSPSSFVQFLRHVAVGLVLEPFIYVRIFILQIRRALAELTSAQVIAVAAAAALLLLGVIALNNQTVGVPKPEISAMAEIDSGRAVHILAIQKMNESQFNQNHPQPLEINIATESVTDAFAGNVSTRTIAAVIEIVAPANLAAAPVVWSKAGQYDGLEYQLVSVQESSHATQIVIAARAADHLPVSAQDSVVRGEYHRKSGIRKATVRTVYTLTSAAAMSFK